MNESIIIEEMSPFAKMFSNVVRTRKGVKKRLIGGKGLLNGLKLTFNPFPHIDAF